MNPVVRFIQQIAYRAALILLLFSGTAAFTHTAAQSIMSAKNVGLSGSGMAYLSGPVATFGNPANLMLSSPQNNFFLTVGTSAASFNPVIPSASVADQINNYVHTYQPYKYGSALLSTNERHNLLDMHYGDKRLLSSHQQQADILLAGALWRKENHSISIGLRARYGSSIQVGRGWYDSDFIKKKSHGIRDFSLIQQRSERYELAIGYAQELTFINGLLPGTNKLYIGITPKIIIAGPYFNAQYDARSLHENDKAIQPIEAKFANEFHLQSSGRYSRAIQQYRQYGWPQRSIDTHLSNGYSFKPTGYGLGFDFGLNFLIPLDNNIAEGNDKSIRVGLSLNDIGAIRYHEDPLRINFSPDTSMTFQQSSVNRVFTGSAGQYLSFLDHASSLPNPILEPAPPSGDSYTSLLPASVNAGILLDMKVIKLMGELDIGLDHTAFTSKDLKMHLGMEVHPIRQIPVRLGTTLSKNKPFELGLGTGLETKYWDFNLATAFFFQSNSPKAFLAGGAFGGIQFHF